MNMKRNQKTLALLLVFMLFASMLSACGQKAPGSSQSWSAPPVPNLSDSNDKEDADSVTGNYTENVGSNAAGARVFVGDSIFVICADGSLWGWGDNTNGQLGNGTRENASAPIHIMDGVKTMATGYSHVLAVKEDGSLWVWGSNDVGELGDGTREYRFEPIWLMDGVRDVAAGTQHSFAIKEDGSLWAWGLNGDGQVGVGNTQDALVPVKIMEDVKCAAGGLNHSLAVKNDGSLWAWGNNRYGQLGRGNTDESFTPVKIMDGVAAVDAGQSYSLMLMEDGSLWTCGCDIYLGGGERGSHALTPIHVLDDVRNFSAGLWQSLAVTKDGGLWVWGRWEMWNGKEYVGLFGDGTFKAMQTPIRIMEDVLQAAAGLSGFAIKDDGSLWGWGRNDERAVDSSEDAPMDILEPIEVLKDLNLGQP